MPFKVFTVSEVLTAASMNDYLMEQVVIVCTSATRPSSPNEGMVVYETDTFVYSMYNGTAWVRLVTPGAWETYTPSWTSTGTAPALGNGTIAGRYCRTGRSVTVAVALGMGGTTTYGTGTYSISLPIQAANPALGGWAGSGYMRDTSAGANGHFLGGCKIGLNATTVEPIHGVSTAGPTIPFTWASGDSMTLTITYEVS